MKVFPWFCSRALPVVALLVLGAMPRCAFGWGKTGHAVVATIAEAHLTPKAAAEVKRLLAVEGFHHMAEIASWADQAKAQHLPGSPSHTIRLPLDGTPAPAHPCPGHFCADDALTQYGAALADAKLTDAQREIALKYVVHLVGDLHQPLHGVSASGQMPVLFHGDKMTLHQVWDDGILEMHGGSVNKIARELMKEGATAPEQGEPADWAREDLLIAQHDIYNEVSPKATEPTALPRDYAKDKWPIVERRLTEAGLRLARILNQLIG